MLTMNGEAYSILEIITTLAAGPQYSNIWRLCRMYTLDVQTISDRLAY